MTDTFKEKVFATIKKYDMLKDVKTVVAAVSGGADSLCLLHFFNKFLKNEPYNLTCVHINHHIRGEEALRDENFVREFCKKRGIDFILGDFSVPEISRETGESLEECGRRVRYEFLNMIAKNYEKPVIATAHHLNDSLETAVFNFSRGTGLKGLSGINPKRDNVIRPLIECTREEIEDYLKEENLDFVTDGTNLLDDARRNIIRHNVIPELRKINPSVESAFLSFSKIISSADDFINETIEAKYNESFNNGKIEVDKILNSPYIIRTGVLMKFVKFSGGSYITSRQIALLDSVLKKGGSACFKGVKIRSNGKYLYKLDEDDGFCFKETPFDPAKTEYKLGLFKVYIAPIDKKNIKLYNGADGFKYYFLDGGKLAGSFFRLRREGDRFKFPGSEHSKTLKNLFSERGIPPEDRGKIPILANENDILWIYGAGTSDYAKITMETESVILIKTENKRTD